MVRMGEQLPDQAKGFISTAVDASEELADQLASNFRVDVDASDVSEVAAKLANELRRDAFLKANGAKFERELYEKYGVLKDIILHPTVQWLLGVWAQLWRSFHLFGKPPLGIGAGVIVALMIYRKKVGFVNMAFTLGVLSGLNPLVVVVVGLVWKFWASSKLVPRGCRFNPEFEAPDDLGPDKLSDDFEPDKVSTSVGEEYDHIVVGSNLGGLFCAALLARCGRRVLVLEEGPLVGAGAVVKAPEGTGDWEFETGVQCLGGGGKLARFLQRLQLACLPKKESGKESLKWEKVGQLESDLCVHDMVSIGDGQQSVMFPAEQEKLLESLTSQFPERRVWFRAFFGQAEREMLGGANAFYLLKLFAARPVKWLDRVIVAAFAAAPGMAHVEIAKRSVSEILGAMMPILPNGNDDTDAARAGLCALFRSENLPASRVSCAALMAQTSSSWGGLYHPRGGFRALAERLVDAIHASGGRVLTRAKAVSVIVRDGRAAGVSIVREGAGASAAATAVDALVIGSEGLGSVISSIGVIDSFRGLVPPDPEAANTATASGPGASAAGALATAGARGAVAGAGAGAGAGTETAKSLGEKEGDGRDPAGFRILRAARPRVHLCVGLQGNWLEDLDGTSSYVHHVRDSTVEGGSRGSDRYDAAGTKHDWYRISFGESKDSASWEKKTTTVVVTAEMGDDMCKMTIDGLGTTNEPIGPLRYTVQSGRSSRDRMRERLLRRLHQDFPETEGRDEFMMLAEQPRAGLSNGPERYLAVGVRAPTKLPGFFLAGEDLTVTGMEGSVMGGWIAAHTALGYSATDLFLRGRSLASDIPNLDKLRGLA